MAERDIETRTKAMEEYASASNTAEKSAVSAASKIVDCFEKLKGASAKVEAGIKKVEDSYKNFGNAANELAASVGEVKKAVDEATSGNAGKPQGDKPGFWDFFKGRAQDHYEGIVSGVSAKFKELDKDTAIAEESMKRLGAVGEGIFQATQQEMLNFVETGKFSTKEFGRIILQQIKQELAGLAARAAIWALFETAAGFASLGWRDFDGAKAHFAAAGYYATVSVTSLGTAMGVQAMMGGTKEREDNPGPQTASSRGKSLANLGQPSSGLAANSAVLRSQNITIQIYNPLSEQNWQKIVEDNIIPSINNASDRNISITVKNMAS